MSTDEYEHPAYQPGNVIIESTPLVYCFLPGETITHCTTCLKSPNDTLSMPDLKPHLKTCGNCGKLSYCSRECQKLDWNNFHKFECKNFANCQLFDHGYTRFYFRLLILYRNRREELTKQFDVLGGKKRCFMDLDDRMDYFQADDEYMVHLIKTISFFAQIEPNFTWKEEEFLLLIFKLHANSFGITDAFLRTIISLGLFIEVTIFLHSCTPNAEAVFIGPKMQVRALKDIAANEPIYVARCLIQEVRKARAERLMHFNYLECSCVRCIKADQEDEKLCTQFKILGDAIEAEYTRYISSDDFDWDKVANLSEKYIELREKIYGKYHPRLSNDKVDYFLLTAKSDKKPNFTPKQLLEELMITHGPEHATTKFFEFISREIPEKSLDRKAIQEIYLFRFQAKRALG